MARGSFPDIKGKTGRPPAAGVPFAFLLAVLCAAVPSPARAQADTDNGQLINQIHELQNQVQTLSRAVYQGNANAAALESSGAAPAQGASGGGLNPAAVSDFYSQLSALQSAQQTLTGQVEKLGFQLQQLTDRVDRMQSDTDERFRQLSQNAQPAATDSTVAPPSSSPSSLSSSSATPAAAPGQSGTLGTLGGDAAPQTLYESAFADVRGSKYADAETKFKTFMQKYPDNPLCANAEYWLGEIYYAQAKYKDAARTFAEGYQKYPKSGKAEDSLYKLGLSLDKMNRHDDACLSLQQIHKDFPGDAGPLYQKTQAKIKDLNCH